MGTALGALWPAANAEDLVSRGRILSDFTKNYSSDIHGAFAVTANRLDDAATVANKSKMLIASVADFSKPACWGGDLTMLLASQALRITVKLVCSIDMMSRKRDEASATLETDRGSTRKDNINPEDNRHSQTFLPGDAVSSLRVGGGDRTVTEATVILTSSCTQASAGELDNLVEVTKATTCCTGCQFAAVSKKDRSTPPFPLVRAAPPLFQAWYQVPRRACCWVCARDDARMQLIFFAADPCDPPIPGAGREAEQAAHKASLGVQPGWEAAAAATRAAEEAAIARRQARKIKAVENRQLELAELANARQHAQRKADKEEAKRRPEKGETREAQNGGMRAGTGEGTGVKAGDVGSRGGGRGQKRVGSVTGDGSGITGAGGAMDQIQAKQQELEVVIQREVEARANAKKCKTRHFRLKAESELAQHLWKKDMQNSQNDYAAVVTIMNRTLKEGRVSAAVARRKYDKAAAATSRVSRKLRKVLGGQAVGAGDKDDSDVDSDSSTRSHCSNDNWFSADELSSDEGSKDELEAAVKARAAAVRQGHEERKRRVLACRAAAMAAKRNYKRLLTVR
ncbi:unnamed protein product [Ectocarpus sp. CCAP 1310/34]|nr:unnamed protein product [Ectocarpus sp. CCAP 1310/34]